MLEVTPDNFALYNADCMDIMPTLETGSIDCILADLPYQITQCHWDSMIPLEPLWEQYKRLIKPNGAIVLFGSQPFTSELVMSNLKMFKYEWIWIKNRGSNFANTVREPMKEHESILIFANSKNSKWTYNKQMQERTGGGKSLVGAVQKDKGGKTENFGTFAGKDITLTELRVPSSWQKFNTEVGLHPTQKPVALIEYLIKTYTNPGEVVLDNVMGSATTGVACVNTGRAFIGIEKELNYFNIVVERIKKARTEKAKCEHTKD